jgi:hypothetical protein
LEGLGWEEIFNREINEIREIEVVCTQGVGDAPGSASENGTEGTDGANELRDEFALPPSLKLRRGKLPGSLTRHLPLMPTTEAWLLGIVKLITTQNND